MSDYTPTTEEVRDHYASYPGARFTPETAEWFDRWLAEHDRQVAERAWHEGWRHESDYLNEWGQFCPTASCNPYREASK